MRNHQTGPASPISGCCKYRVRPWLVPAATDFASQSLRAATSCLLSPRLDCLVPIYAQAQLRLKVSRYHQAQSAGCHPEIPGDCPMTATERVGEQEKLFGPHVRVEQM